MLINRHFINTSSSYLVAAFITPGFTTENKIDVYLTIINHVIYATIYFVLSINILNIINE